MRQRRDPTGAAGADGELPVVMIENFSASRRRRTADDPEAVAVTAATADENAGAEEEER